jgi:hypothetical protein
MSIEIHPFGSEGSVERSRKFAALKLLLDPSLQITVQLPIPFYRADSTLLLSERRSISLNEIADLPRKRALLAAPHPIVSLSLETV